MPVKVSSFDLNDVNYKAGTIRADVSLGLLSRVIQFIGPPVASYPDLQGMMEGLGRALSGGDQNVVELVKEIITAANLRIDDNDMTGEHEWTLFFSDRLGDLLQVVVWIGGQNWTNFFDALKVVEDGFQKASQKEST